MRYGGHYIKNRSQDLSDALMDTIEAAGGNVLLETEVTRITMKDEVVTGVMLDDGQHLEAKAIVSNASVPATMKMLSDDNPSYVQSKWQPQVSTNSTISIK